MLPKAVFKLQLTYLIIIYFPKKISRKKEKEMEDGKWEMVNVIRLRRGKLKQNNIHQAISIKKQVSSNRYPDYLLV